jgi:hypothetical protein
MRPSLLLLAAASLLLPIVGFAPLAPGQDLTTPERLRQTVSLQNVAMDANGTVSGTIANRSDLTISNVKLEIDYSWVWRNDLRPGEDSPARTVYVTAPAAIPPHGQGSFTYQPSPPLPSRTDGHFVPLVHIVGLTQVGA